MRAAWRAVCLTGISVGAISMPVSAQGWVNGGLETASAVHAQRPWGWRVVNEQSFAFAGRV
jgi:hypothetical protein